ncbi:GNAT N-acetyltransferase [Paracoccus caeni]|uniref:GNAT N-acetyltransferase n=1 Tax=Paracoccus caeni TaxID=657651 RepID=A0A934SH59_9RHOB|nr:GNAT family N-acetyltransferase [Paracoccus caeni]MBK4215317.1 GNAT N-acetyltransferase [Paracoccus caeni]
MSAARSADRVRLSRPKAADADDFVAVLNDPDVSAWLDAVPQPYHREDALRFVAAAGPCEHVVRVDDRVAGTVRASDSFGIWIAPEFQRQGVGTRAAVLALSRRFRDGSRTISARRRADNHRSARLLDALGFVFDQPPIEDDSGSVTLTLTRDDFARHHGIRITTERLLIDAYQPQDLGDLYRIATEPRIASMLLRFWPGMPLSEAEAILRTDALTPPIRLVVRHQGRVIGSIGISAGDPPSIFYFLDPAMLGQGIGREMLPAFLNEIDARFAPETLQAEAFMDNLPSRNLLERFGFVLEREMMVASKGRAAPMPGGIYRRGSAMPDTV